MKYAQSIFRFKWSRAVLGGIALAGLLVGCSSQDYTSYTNTSDYVGSGSYGYGSGVYDAWGYAGNPYHGGGVGVVIVQPVQHPDSDSADN